MTRPWTRRGAILAGTATLAAPVPLRAQSPAIDRPARMVVGFPPGGGADIVARLFAERLRGLYAPQVLVENRTGAAARLAVEAVKSAAPDGQTILMTPESVLVIYPHTYPRTLRYDALRDFAPAAGMLASGLCLLVAANHPARDFQGFIQWARARGQEVDYASPAAGSTPFFLAHQMALATGITMNHVSYRGSQAAVPDLLSGRLQAMAGVTGEFTPWHRDGRVRILAVSSRERAAGIPEVPTMVELGFPQIVIEAWWMALLPAGTPAPIVQALNRAVQEVAATPDMRAQIARLDLFPTPGSPEQVAERIRSETERWGPIVRATGFVADD